VFRIQLMSQATAWCVWLHRAAYSAGGQVAQDRVAVPAFVLVLEVADDDSGVEQGVSMVAVEALLPEPVVERFDVAIVPWCVWRDVGQADFPAQNCCSACETSSGPLSMRSTFGGPPGAAKAPSNSATSRSAVIERFHQMPQRHPGVVRRSSTRS
jgi:hypothetical protein